MEKNTPTYQVTLDHKALAYLQPSDSERISRMEAYRMLLQKAAGETRDNVTIAGTTVKLTKGQFPTTISELAKELKWNRVSVRQFIRQLRELHLLQICHYGKFEVITMDYTDGLSERPRLFSEWEQTLTRWLCGYIAIEDMVKEAVKFISDTDFLFGSQKTDGSTEVVTSQGQERSGSTGMRLHRLMSHLILHYTDMMPHNEEVINALATTFNDYCHQDFSEFWLKLSTYMIARHATTIRANGEAGITPMDLTAGYPKQLQLLLDTIASYYIPFIKPKGKNVNDTSHKALKTDLGVKQ